LSLLFIVLTSLLWLCVFSEVQALAVALKGSLRESMAQKIRAVLLAVTTVANLAGFFWSMLTTHGPAISGWALSAAEFEMAGQ